MSAREIQSPGGSSHGRERLGILTLAVVVVGVVALYLLSRTNDTTSANTRNLLPYQVLTRELSISEQQMYTAIRSGLPALEAGRAKTLRWPEPAAMTADRLPPFTGPDTASITWHQFQRGAAVAYFAAPADPSAPAWLLMIHEPEPNTPPDPAPLDDEHHRLPDGTTLHVYVWYAPLRGPRHSGLCASTAERGVDGTLRNPSYAPIGEVTVAQSGHTHVRLITLLAVAAVALSRPASAQAQRALKIGVTLHPYYSWTSNIVGSLPGYEIRAILPGEIDAGDYQPRPDDIKKLVDLDAIVINGIGHDDFILPMIKASGNTRIAIVRVNEATPQIHAAQGSGVNSHTFISFTNAVQQTYTIQKALAALRPADAVLLQRNAADYARRLRLIKANASRQLAGARVTRVVTVHDGMGYLLQEFGLEVAGVVQPVHGLTPSAGELRDMVKLLQREKIRVVFSEETFPTALLRVLRDEAGVRVYTITHIASGQYTPDKFEREMQRNAETLVRALVTEG